MEHPLLDFHAQLSYRNAKSPTSCDAGLLDDRLKLENYSIWRMIFSEDRYTLFRIMR